MIIIQYSAVKNIKNKSVCRESLSRPSDLLFCSADATVGIRAEVFGRCVTAIFPPLSAIIAL